MKRAIAIFAMLASSAVFAQVHGIPPSVTSYNPLSPQTRFAPGPRPSVTSLGPFGYTFFGPGARKFIYGRPPHFHRGPFGNGSGYVYVPYAYPVPVPMDNGYAPVDPNDPNAAAMGPTGMPVDPPANNASDPRYGQHYLDSRENSAPAPVATAEPATTAESVPAPSPTVEKLLPVVVIFKDGHQQEIENYAIVGDTLYAFGDQRSYKIKLADLDLKATQEKNDERGVEFHLPASVSPDS